ncbi:D-Ala-D-Ala carboxypeptidase family metallohydrolase [Anaerofustis sp.]|uniref:D-Ala-D-Ala carboxypeptidase family metallohydrolase n=1 Tax=Anaerofustis sp. TaxID=1872517 RepID=UPI0025C174A7|nr:D-Ala-D-Ala carboxypeptidase family metallohydrolase [Anaerofustis sp.]
MNVKIYSKSKDGNKSVPGAPHFKIREFACHDGTDKIYIDIDHAKKLEKIRLHFNKSIHINSGYRTVSYNKKIGGASESYHTKGRAFDIFIQGINVKTIAKYAESIGIKGIGCYPNANFVHIDSRGNKFYYYYSNSYRSVKTFGGNPAYYPIISRGSRGNYVKKAQNRLIKKGYKIASDGIFGTATYNATKNFQKKSNLTADGIIGKATWKKLYK